MVTKEAHAEPPTQVYTGGCGLCSARLESSLEVLRMNLSLWPQMCPAAVTMWLKFMFFHRNAQDVTHGFFS